MGLFSKKSPTEKLYKKRDKLLKEAHSLSTVNRTASDKKMAEAEEILEKIKSLETQHK